MRVIAEETLRIVKVGPMGPYNNNAYLVRDTAAEQTLLVDMPLETATLLDAMAAEGEVTSIIATHWHPDHWMSYDAVRAATGAPVLVGSKEIKIPAERIDGRLDDGATLRVGSHEMTVLHTPGHTPGSISLRIGPVVITGDTLFAGGPGKTFAAGELEVLIVSIERSLLPLPPQTVVLPGHGVDTDIASSRRGVAAYRHDPKPAGFFGDVEWPQPA